MSEIDNVIYGSYFRLSTLFENLCTATLPYEATASAQRRVEKLMSSRRSHQSGVYAPLTVKKESRQTSQMLHSASPEYQKQSSIADSHQLSR